MTDYTPTTDQVRFAAETSTFPESALTDGAFDRWLAAHDRKVAAVAWDAAVRSMRYEDGTPVELVSVVNPYRADRIEQGGES